MLTLTLTLTLTAAALAAPPADDARCADLARGARGLCNAALAAGCDDPSNDEPACSRLSELFTSQTGTAPPWEAPPLPPCPCGESEDFIAFVAAYAEPATCDATVDFLFLNVPSRTNVVFTYRPGTSVSKRSCGYDNTSLEVFLNDDQLASCEVELRQAADALGATCPS